MSKFSNASAGNFELEKALLALSANGSLPIVTGNVYLVIPSSDSNYVEIYNKYQKTYSDGSLMVHNTISSAYSSVVSDRNDVILLSANASHAQTSMLTIAKNRVHFVGLDMGGRMYGQRSRISMGVTTAATDLGVMKNTGVGNSFRNIKFTSANTKAESIYCVLEAGEYAVYENCEFYKETDLDVTGAAELVLNGDSAQFKDCTIGSLANAIATADLIRPNVTLVKELAGSGKVMRDCKFEHCFFWRRSGHVNNRFIYAAADADVERMLIIENSVFYNAANSVALPAQCISSGASLTVGSILVVNPAFIKATKLSTTTGVFVVGAATGATAGLATQAA